MERAARVERVHPRPDRDRVVVGEQRVVGGERRRQAHRRTAAHDDEDPEHRGEAGAEGEEEQRDGADECISFTRLYRSASIETGTVSSRAAAPASATTLRMPVLSSPK